MVSSSSSSAHPFSHRPLPPKTTKEKHEERVKKKEEDLKLKKKKEAQIHNDFGFSKIYKYPAKTLKQLLRPKIIAQPLKFDIPFLTEFSIMEALARPNEGSQLNPVTDMTLVPLTIANLNQHVSIPVLDLDHSTRNS